jgi:hypothetical protein
MSSRVEQKQKLREEREAKERQAREAAARRRRLTQLGAGVAVVVIAAVIAVVALSGGGSKAKGPGSGGPGLQNTAGPWGTGTADLEKRATAMGLPDPSDTAYHVHAQVTVYTDGKKQTVPANIGIDSGGQYLASLHTHDTRGVIHMEAIQPFPFKLGQFFKVWNVPFSATQLGSFHSGGGLVLQTWVNGKQVKDGVNYAMKPHDKIVVGFGKPGSFPTKSNFKFPAGE